MSFPRHSGRYDLLGTEAYRDLLAKNIASATRSITIISAFITSSGLSWVLRSGIRRDLLVTIITQWSPGDLLAGASDLDAYTLAQDQGWKFRLLPKLHAKALLIDDLRLFVGSANVTAFGLSLVPGGNRELGLCVGVSEAELRTIAGLINESVEVSAELFCSIRDWLSQQKLTTTPTEISWPENIHRAMVLLPTRLWVADLPWANPHHLLGGPQIVLDPSQREAIDHDFRLYGTVDAALLLSAFRNSVAFKWLVGMLQTEPDQMAYFGRLSYQLHASLLDDPTPYRKEVKNLLANLLEYVATFAAHQVQLDRPNQSLRARLLAPSEALL
jgi:hypothetical protein